MPYALSPQLREFLQRVRSLLSEAARQAADAQLGAAF
jgi:hypothetical protein